MPLPLILGGLAVTAAATGAKKAYDAYKDKSLVDSIIVDNANEQYQIEESRLQVTQAETKKSK